MLAGREVPIYATSNVTSGILSTHEIMAHIATGFFGEEEIERSLSLPNTLVKSG